MKPRWTTRMMRREKCAKWEKQVLMKHITSSVKHSRGSVARAFAASSFWSLVVIYHVTANRRSKDHTLCWFHQMLQNWLHRAFKDSRIQGSFIVIHITCLSPVFSFVSVVIFINPHFMLCVLSACLVFLCFQFSFCILSLVNFLFCHLAINLSLSLLYASKCLHSRSSLHYSCLHTAFTWHFEAIIF